MWAIFSSWAQKKGKGKVSKANTLPKWDSALAALAIAIAAGMLRNSAWATKLSAVGLRWLCQYCRAILVWHGVLPVWRVKCQSLWCHDFMVPQTCISDPCMCVCVYMYTWEWEIHVHRYTPTFAHTSICIHTGPLYSLQSKLDLNDSLETK